MKNSKIFSTRALSLAQLSWREALESLRVMKSRMNILILSLTDGLTKEWCIATHLFWKVCSRKGKRSGWLFLALYLKQCRVCLQRYCAGDSVPDSLSPAVSLTRCGLPRIIPSFHRGKIRRGDARIIQLYMSLFTVSKLIPLAKKIDKTLFTSIVSPSDLDTITTMVAEMKPKFRLLLSRYVPHVDSIPLFQGLEFTPTWKAVPTGQWYRNLMKGSADSEGKPLKRFSKHQSVFPCFFAELGAFAELMTFVHARGEQYSQGCLWYPFIRYAFDINNKLITNWSLDWFERRLGPLLPTSSVLGIPMIAGRLCQACTGDGKRRIFAIGNYINQRLLYPLHQWLANVLKRIPMDGTFDQTRPLDRLAGVKGTVHSVDLKSATDRWPLHLMFELTQSLFDRSFASSAVNSALGTNIFQVAFVKSNQHVSFVAGQPLGLYSSWPLFALSHHFVVWYAAEQEYPGIRFKNYAVLGDDVIIADTAVNTRYREIITRLGVAISEGKSLNSPSGACEFAKRFRLDRMTVDASPLSLKKIASSKSPIGWYNFITTLPRPVRLSTALRIGGFGFKAASRRIQSSKHGKRARRLIVMLMKFHMAHLPLELCLIAILGRILLPQQRGRLISLLLEHFVPKELELAPEEVYPYPGMRDFEEYSLRRGWMKQYLTYLKWYALLHQNVMYSEVSLDDFFEAPVYTSRWYKTDIDHTTYRFGIAFRIVDLYQRVSEEEILLLPENHSGASFGAFD